MSFAAFFIIGMCAMFLPILYGGRIYSIPIWKTIISAIILTGIGLLGAHLMALIEVGNWKGRSFFGAHFLVPILMWPVAKILNIPYGKLLDICAPAGCIMLALLKVKCYFNGCCGGRYMQFGDIGFVFPSQIVECVVAIILMLVLLVIIKKRKWERLVYPWYMFLYGIIRFILNLFRDTSPWIGPLPSGNFWALISLVIGGAILLYYKRNIKKID